MIKKKDITVIIPVHEWNEDIRKMYNAAYKSIGKGPSVIVATTEDSGFSESKEAESVNVVKSSEGGSFQHLVNLGAENVTTEWFSILEFDDEFTPIWFDNFIKYQEYNQQYNIFMPLNDLYNVEGGKHEFVGNGNEAVLAASFSDEIGVIDEASLEDYFSYYIPGSVIKTELWKNLGGLKEGIKLTFWYEFLLRAAHKGEKMYVVPKVGYIHVLGREGSLMQQYRSEIDAKESDFWFKQAKRQSYHKQDKHVIYEPGKEEEKKEG
jgi:hypothetical protein